MGYPEFQNRTAMATGGASGIALLFLQQMAQNRANVVLCDVNIEAAEAEAEKIRAAGGNAIACQVDVRKYDQIEAAVNTALEKFGSVDYLLNAAGGNSQRICRQTGGFINASPESIEWGVDVNLKGAILFTRAVLGKMLDQKYGVIINMGSIDGVTGAQCLDYTASKAGMIGLSQGTANIGAPYGVRSMCVSPGPVLTRPAMANMKTLLGRAAETIEVVDLILYLCSDKAAFITGQNYVIDGGRALAASHF